MDDQRNFIVAIVISLVILVGWQMFFAPKTPPHPPASQTAASPTADQPTPGAAGLDKLTPPQAVPSPAGDITPERQNAVAAEKRIRINTPQLHGSISLTGLRIDDITLANFHETTDPQSPEITLLSPPSAPKPYYVETGWTATEHDVKLPTATTVWSVDNPDMTLTGATPLVAHWDNGEGLRFTRTISVDDNFLFTVEQTVTNGSDHPVTLYPYSLVARVDTPQVAGTYLIHEGPIGVFNRTSKEVKYKDLRDKQHETEESTGGWIGITDKYWLAAIALDQSVKVDAGFTYTKPNDRDRYQTDLLGAAVAVPPGESRALKSYVFAGAKIVKLLDQYSDNPGISRFDLAVDWGWFYFLTKPFFYCLEWIKGWIGNFGLAILVFTVGLRLVMFPIMNKQYAGMNKMRALQPKMKALQERYADDRAKLNQELMELYRRENYNPMSGCLPIVLQIPIFFALYKVIYVSIEMWHAPFYGWIHDLSARDPTNVFNLFGLIHFTPPFALHLGALPIIYGITMFLQQKMSPQVGDPAQQRVMLMMPLVFVFVLASVPAGVVIYWTWSALLGILQQWALMKTHGRPTPATTKA